jgi:uncharacterized protein YjeT (DUF2065 family)
VLLKEVRFESRSGESLRRFDGSIAMMNKRKLDRVGGLGSILAGMGCLWLASTDWEMHQSMWQVWVGMCAILVLNGIAMIWHAQRSRAESGKAGKAMGPLAEPAVARGSTHL